MSTTRYINPKLKRRLIAGECPEWLTMHVRASYIIAAVLSAPFWVDRKALYALRDQARELSKSTGVPHVLDHIVPLCHPCVCGLTVPWNIRVVPHAVNAAKGGEWHPDQLELSL